MIRARFENGELVGLTDEDQRALKNFFPDEVHLNSDNCPELAAEIDKISDEVFSERKNLYRRLGNFD